MQGDDFCLFRNASQNISSLWFMYIDDVMTLTNSYLVLQNPQLFFQDRGFRLRGCLWLGPAVDCHSGWVHPARGKESLPSRVSLQTEPWEELVGQLATGLFILKTTCGYRCSLCLLAKTFEHKTKNMKRMKRQSQDHLTIWALDNWPILLLSAFKNTTGARIWYSME